MKTPIHAINRFKKRIGHEITESQLQELNELIINDDECVELVKWRRGNDISVYRIKWKGLEFYAIYFLTEYRIISFRNIEDEVHEDLGEYWREHDMQKLWDKE